MQLTLENTSVKDIAQIEKCRLKCRTCPKDGNCKVQFRVSCCRVISKN